jgi:hypothetical protein
MIYCVTMGVATAAELHSTIAKHFEYNTIKINTRQECFVTVSMVWYDDNENNDKGHYLISHSLHMCIRYTIHTKRTALYS